METIVEKLSATFANDEPMTKHLGISKETVKKYCFEPVLNQIDKNLSIVTENIYTDEVFGG